MTEPLFTLPPYDEAIAYLREHFAEIERRCSYSSPCAIGVLIPDDDVRTALDTLPGLKNIRARIHQGLVRVSSDDDREAFGKLQEANDHGTVTDLRRLIFGESVPS